MDLEQDEITCQASSQPSCIPQDGNVNEDFDIAHRLDIHTAGTQPRSINGCDQQQYSPYAQHCDTCAPLTDNDNRMQPYSESHTANEDLTEPCTEIQQNPRLTGPNLFSTNSTTGTIDPLLCSKSAQDPLSNAQQIEDSYQGVRLRQHHEPTPHSKIEDWRYVDSSYDAQSTHSRLEDECDKTTAEDGIENVVHSRKSRSHDWPPLSDPCPVVALPTHFNLMTIGFTGCESGRNLLAIFQRTDGKPRTRYKLRILRGRGPSYLSEVHQYPACNVTIPACQTLEQICQKYPRHVWGTGLRMFIAEGWTGERIYNALPEDFRDSKAMQRPWNYIQQGFTREVKRMNGENGIHRPVQRRKRTYCEMEADRLLHNQKLYNSAVAGPGNTYSIHPLHIWPSNRYTPLIPRSTDRRCSVSSELQASINSAAVRCRDSEDHFASEYQRQYILLFDLMQALYPHLCSKLDGKQRQRIHIARASIFNDFGGPLEDATLSDVRAFTVRLQRLTSELSLQYSVGRGESHFSFVNRFET